KVQFAFHELRKPVIAMDAGFFIHSLNGFPMMYVKPVLQSIGIEGLLKLTEGKSRTCEFREVLAYVDRAGMKPKLFISTVKVTLALKPSGVMHDKHWSELTLVFIPEFEKKTMADMNNEEFMDFRKNIEQ